MASIKLTSGLYKNEQIDSITFSPSTNYSNKKNQEFIIPNPTGNILGEDGYTFDPGQRVEGLIPGDIFGEYIISYSNGCDQDIIVTGDTATCGDFTATIVSSGVFYETQSSSSLFPDEDNGFELASVTPATITDDPTTTYTATYYIPEMNTDDEPFANWLNGTGTLNGCESGQVPNHAKIVDCESDEITSVTFSQNQNQGDTISAFNLPNGVSASVTPAFNPTQSDYTVQYTSTPVDSGLFFGFNNGNPVTTLNCPLKITSEIFNCADYGFDLESITPSTTNGEIIAAGPVSTSGLFSHSSLPTGVSIVSVLNEDGNDAWVLGTSEHTYTVTLELTDSGLYNDSGDYEGPQECTVSASACVNDIDSEYVPTSAL